MRRHPYLTVFCVTAGVYLLALKTYFGYDGQVMFRVTEAIAMHHSFRISDPIWHFNEPYATYGPGVSLMLLPFFWLGQLLTQDGTRLVILYEPVVTAASVAVLARLLGELGCSWPRRVLLSAIYAFGTLAWYYSTTIFSEPLVALSLTLAVLGLVRYRRHATRADMLTAGIAVGVALLTRVDSAVMIALPCTVYAVYLLLRSHGSMRNRLLSGAAFLGPLLAGVLIDLGYNYVRYGNPLDSGRLPYPGTFNTPVLTGLYGLLLSPGAGLLLYCPIALVGLVACWWFFRRSRSEATLVAALIAMRLLFYARWDAWMGLEWGARFLVPILPLFIVPIVFLPRRRWVDLFTGIAGGVGTVIQIVGQLIPFGTVVWPRVAPAVAAALHLPAPGGCICSSYVDLKVHEAMALHWRFSPLHAQMDFLLAGGNISLPYLVGMLAGLAVALATMLRAASKRGQPDTPRDEDVRVAAA